MLGMGCTLLGQAWILGYPLPARRAGHANEGEELRAEYAQSSLIACSKIPPQSGPVGEGSLAHPLLGPVFSSCPLHCPPPCPMFSELASSSRVAKNRACRC